jgi:hypothetical protein
MTDGSHQVVIVGFGSSSHAHVMVGPPAHRAKVAFERYFLASRRRGLIAV